MTRVSMLAVESGNVFNLQDFEQNKIPFKQRSFEDSIDTFLSLFVTDMDEYFSTWFKLGPAHRANNFMRGVYQESRLNCLCPFLLFSKKYWIIQRKTCIKQYQNVFLSSLLLQAY